MDTNELRRLLGEATKGPWEKSAQRGFPEMVTHAADREEAICEVLAIDHDGSRYFYGKTSEANQTLIVAAVNALPALLDERKALLERLEKAEMDAARLDYIERTFSGMTNRERYLPVQMIWGKGANGRTLREACDKYINRDAAMKEPNHEG